MGGERERERVQEEKGEVKDKKNGKVMRQR
jgi:hypothetical protein